MERIGPLAKCAPPLRSSADQDSLWEHLDEITTIGSDHSPSPPEMKQHENFFEVWGGISGCQHLLPLLIDAGAKKQNKLTSQRIISLTSQNVVRRFGLAHKGEIAAGRDADFTLVDPRAQETVSVEGLHYRHRQSPYVGQTLQGRVLRTILRGQTVFHDGKFPARPFGKFVRPDRS